MDGWPEIAAAAGCLASVVLIVYFTPKEPETGAAWSCMIVSLLGCVRVFVRRREARNAAWLEEEAAAREARGEARTA